MSALTLEKIKEHTEGGTQSRLCSVMDEASIIITKSTSYLLYYTVLEKTPHFHCFLYNSVKNESILMILGTLNPEDI